MIARKVLAGVLVGGKSRRMGGTPKGLLRLPTSKLSLVENLVQQLHLSGIDAIRLVGTTSDYSPLGLPVVSDSDRARGPMAGLLALFESSLQQGYDEVLAFACDMPNVDARLISRLLHEQLDVAALVPRRTYWEPLCARYSIPECLPALHASVRLGNFRLHHYIETLGVLCRPLLLDSEEQVRLSDWDSPADLPPGYRVHLSRAGELDENTVSCQTDVGP